MAVRPSSSTKMYSIAVSPPPIATSTLSDAMVGQIEKEPGVVAVWTDNGPGVNTSLALMAPLDSLPASAYILPLTALEVNCDRPVGIIGPIVHMSTEGSKISSTWELS